MIKLRRQLQSKLCRVFAVAATLLLGIAPLHAAEQPNILLIFSDDQGMGDVSCYGGDFPTPNIDSIARRGLKFEEFYVAFPICTPSRFGLLTGRYPNRSRDKMMGALMYVIERDDHRGIRAGETTIAELLQERSYRTALIGKWHLGHGEEHFLPNHHGFDYSYGTTGGAADYFTLKYGYKPDWHRNGTMIEESGYATDLISDEAVRFIQRQKKGKPFFLYLAYTAPHYGKGWDAEKQQLTNILQAKDRDRERMNHLADPDRREFAGMVAAMDDGIGRVLDELRRQNLERDTLVIFTCDNGADPRYGGSNGPYRGQKAQLFEGGIRVPCVMQWPGKIPPGSVTRQPVSALDFFPTLCGLTGIDTNGMALDGVNILPVMLRDEEMERDLFWQAANADAFRRGHWKYLRTGKEKMLFHLGKDPFEQNNLAAEHPERLRELEAAHAAVAKTIER